MNRPELIPAGEWRRLTEVQAENARVLHSEGVLQKTITALVEGGDFFVGMPDEERRERFAQCKPLIYRHDWDQEHPWESRDNSYTVTLFPGRGDDAGSIYPAVVGRVLESATGETLEPAERNGFDEMDLGVVHGLAQAMVELRNQGQLPHLAPGLTSLEEHPFGEQSQT